MAFHLYQRSIFYRLGQGAFVVSQHLHRQQPEGGEFVVADVVLFVLGEAVNELRPLADLEEDDCPEPARLSSPLARDPLFHHAAAAVAVDRPRPERPR